MTSESFEIIMVVCFGASWPLNLMKSYRARTTKGTSLLFLLLISFGYICGIVSKLSAESYKWYVLFFYVLNLVMLAVNLLVYWRNYKLDKAKEAI